MEVDAKEARHAARKAVDGSRLLPGEVPDSDELEDAVHWVDVYTELLQGKSAMLAELSGRLAVTREDAAREEFAQTDLLVLRSELDRLQARLDFWSQRKRELEAAATTPG